MQFQQFQLLNSLIIVLSIHYHVNFLFLPEGFIDVVSDLSKFFHILFYPLKSHDNQLRVQSDYLKYCFYFIWIRDKAIFSELKRIKQKILEINCFFACRICRVKFHFLSGKLDKVSYYIFNILLLKLKYSPLYLHCIRNPPKCHKY